MTEANPRIIADHLESAIHIYHSELAATEAAHEGNSHFAELHARRLVLRGTINRLKYKLALLHNNRELPPVTKI